MLGCVEADSLEVSSCGIHQHLKILPYFFPKRLGDQNQNQLSNLSLGEKQKNTHMWKHVDATFLPNKITPKRGLTRTIFVDELSLDFGCDAGESDCEVQQRDSNKGILRLSCQGWCSRRIRVWYIVVYSPTFTIKLNQIKCR